MYLIQRSAGVIALAFDKLPANKSNVIKVHVLALIATATLRTDMANKKDALIADAR